MKRQQNTYTVVGAVAQLLCTDSKGVSYAAIFPAEYYATIRTSQWCYKGKNGIVDSFGVSIAAHFAAAYGYKDGKWVRVEPNEDYFKRNYTAKVAPGPTGATVNRVYGPTRTPLVITYQPRVKWRSKYECEFIRINVARNGVASGTTITVQINKYLRHTIPSHCVLRTDDLGHLLVLCTDGTLLASKVIGYAMGDVTPTVRDTALKDPLDLRVDPNDNTFVSTPYSYVRKHTTEDGIILELLERGDHTARLGWRGDDTLTEQFRMPLVRTKYRNRVCYVMVDSKTVDQINDIWYDDMIGEVMVDDLLVAKKRPLKYLVCDVNGIEYNNIYIAPALNSAYSMAASKLGDTKSKRIVAKYENNVNGAGAHRMYSDAKYITKARLKFNTVGFNDTIYGGVGVHYLDCRPDALYRSVRK